MASDPWRLLYSATLASSFAYTKGLALNEWMADDVLSAAVDIERAAVEGIASDRGPVTADRWRRAALEVLEARLAAQPPPRQPGRSRYEKHVEDLRLDVEAAPSRQEER